MTVEWISTVCLWVAALIIGVALMGGCTTPRQYSVCYTLTTEKPTCATQLTVEEASELYYTLLDSGAYVNMYSD